MDRSDGADGRQQEASMGGGWGPPSFPFLCLLKLGLLWPVTCELGTGAGLKMGVGATLSPLYRAGHCRKGEVGWGAGDRVKVSKMIKS